MEIMLSPIPVPAMPLDVEARKYRSNTFGISASGIPTPPIFNADHCPGPVRVTGHPDLIRIGRIFHRVGQKVVDAKLKQFPVEIQGLRQVARIKDDPVA